ncbi:MAG: hypothetical protein EBU28_09130 [Gammaproteobacteria bacterium]|nr:hypothetical protein [Gammaproteobacteria bacterium]
MRAHATMAGRKISQRQLKKLVLVSIVLGILAGVYYALSPYQRCVREARIDQPDIAEGALVDLCAPTHRW